MYLFTSRWMDTWKMFSLLHPSNPKRVGTFTALCCVGSAAQMTSNSQEVMLPALQKSKIDSFKFWSNTQLQRAIVASPWESQSLQPITTSAWVLTWFQHDRMFISEHWKYFNLWLFQMHFQCLHHFPVKAILFFLYTRYMLPLEIASLLKPDISIWGTKCMISGSAYAKKKEYKITWEIQMYEQEKSSVWGKSFCTRKALNKITVNLIIVSYQKISLPLTYCTNILVGACFFCNVENPFIILEHHY